ncbi:hypothetical protein EBZU44_23740 [Enterobacter cloacae]|nr:hypothetical protein EBZU44_23740 [Enterobacter cloacae]
MENIHVAELEACLLDAVKQHVTVQMGAMMSSHIHDDYRFFTLRLFNNRFWLNNRLWLNARSGLWRRRCRFRLRLFYRLRLLHWLWLMHWLCRLLHRLLLYRLWRNGLLLHRLLRRMTNRFFHWRRRWLARLGRGIRWLILVLRSAGSFMLSMRCAGRSIDPMNTNFTHAVVVKTVDVVFNVIVFATGLHALQWTIAKHRGTLFTAGPETMYQ